MVLTIYRNGSCSGHSSREAGSGTRRITPLTSSVHGTALSGSEDHCVEGVMTAAASTGTLRTRAGASVMETACRCWILGG